jgi:hypothetical protein
MKKQTKKARLQQLAKLLEKAERNEKVQWSVEYQGEYSSSNVDDVSRLLGDSMALTTELIKFILESEKSYAAKGEG